MRHIGNFSGVDIYSDKPGGISMINNRVIFDDGSWYDIKTGQSVNNGPGSLSVGSNSNIKGTTGPVKQKKIGPTPYKAASLTVEGMYADLEIQVGQELSVSIEGDEQSVDAITCEVKGGSLIIKGQIPSVIISNNTISTNGGNVVIDQSIGRGIKTSFGGSVVISGDTQTVSGRGVSVTQTIGSNIRAPRFGFLSQCLSLIFPKRVAQPSGPAKVVITVPRGTPIEVGGVVGDVRIGDTEGRLTLSVSGADDAKIGKVSDAELKATGSGTIKVSHVSGRLKARAKGSGDIKISGGDVSFLDLKASGSGSVTFQGNAVDAYLTASGSGDVYASHVTNRPSKDKSGSGSIRVGNW